MEGVTRGVTGRDGGIGGTVTGTGSEIGGSFYGVLLLLLSWVCTVVEGLARLVVGRRWGCLCLRCFSCAVDGMTRSCKGRYHTQQGDSVWWSCLALQHVLLLLLQKCHIMRWLEPLDSERSLM